MHIDSNQAGDKAPDDYIRLAYQSALEDIRFFKKQQWMVTNYTVLIYGAVIAVSKISGSSLNKWGSFILGVAGLLSLLLIVQLQCSTNKARNRKNAVKSEISDNLAKLLFGEPRSRSSEFFDQYSVVILLVLVVLGGGFLSVCVLSGLNHR
jgi:hypothetical protein